MSAEERSECGCVIGGLHRYQCAGMGHVHPPRPIDTRELETVLRQAARTQLGISEGEFWDSAISEAQAAAVLASDWLAAREAAARAEERERIAQAIEARRVLRRRDNTQGQIDTREALNLAARIARGDS